MWLFDYLSSHPCVDCGETDHRVLDFDHRDRTTKHANVSYLLCSAGFERLKAEVAKCDVRCANCHRRKTAKDGNFYRHVHAPARGSRAGRKHPRPAAA